MTTRFDRDTGLEPVGGGAYEGRVDPGWRITRGANGAHLAVMLLRGMSLTVDDAERAPRSLTVYYARVPEEAPVRVETTIERAGRRVTLASARMLQGPKLMLMAYGAFSVAWEGTDFADISMPEVPGPEECERVPDRDDFPFGQRFDFRPAIAPAALGVAEKAEAAVWMRLREPQQIDALVATQYLDAWAPAVFGKLGHSVGVPTIDMTFHFREPMPVEGATPDDHYLGVFRTTTSRQGFVEEDGWLWSRDGRLVAHSRQLALVFS